MATKRIIKPVPIPTRPLLDFNEIVDYVQAKYGKNMRAGGKRDFVDHMAMSGMEITNGGTIYFGVEEWLNENPKAPKWLKDIYSILQKEFGDEFEVRTSW